MNTEQRFEIELNRVEAQDLLALLGAAMLDRNIRYSPVAKTIMKVLDTLMQQVKNADAA